MDLLPILSTLRRHKTAASLIVIEIALTSAIVCNALHLISTRLATLNRDNGVPETELVTLAVRGTAGGGTAEVDEITAQDLRALRAVPGVKSAALVNQVIYGNNSNNSGVGAEASDKLERTSASSYQGSEDTLATLGLVLAEGRDFKLEEYQSAAAFGEKEQGAVPQVILNQDLANKLFPGQSALGRVIYVFGETPSTVIGVVKSLSHPQPSKRADGQNYSFLAPLRPSYRGGAYLLRTTPEQRDSVLKAATAALERIDGKRIVVEAKRLEDKRRAYYAQDRAMVWLMGGVCVALLLVTAFGIVGLASFWVQQRTRMIGTRRALGATRGQIRGYFQLENFMLSSVGIVLGMVGAFGLSLLLMANYEMQRLPWLFGPVAAVALWALGQLAVLAPARRAANLPPVAALRA